MPNTNFALGNTYETITRPVAFSIAKDCLARMGFPEDAYIDFLGQNESSLNQDSALTPTANRNYFGTNNETTLVVEEDFIINRIYEASTMRPDINPIFRENTCQTYIRPIYAPTEGKINFKVQFVDEVTANRYRDDCWTRANLLRHDGLHTVTYHYPIPDVMIVTLGEIFKRKEAVDKSGQTFGEWVVANSDPRATNLTNQSGKEVNWVVAEDQVRVFGYFDFAGVTDKPTFDKEKNVWTIEWTYVYTYDKAVECAMTYPLVIRQQMLPYPFRPEEGMYRLDQQDINPNNFNRLTEPYGKAFEAPVGFLDARYPDFDTWAPEGGVRGCKIAWLGLTTISPEDQSYMLDLNNLGNHQLADAALAFIESERQYVVDPLRSLIDIGVYSNNNRALPGQIELAADLHVNAIGGVSLEPVYHTVISYLVDLSLLSPEDAIRIRYNACLAYGVMVTIWPTAAELGLLPKPNKRCVWTADQWSQIVKTLSPTRPGIGYPNPSDPNGLTNAVRRRIMQTVGTYHLVTRRT